METLPLILLIALGFFALSIVICLLILLVFGAIGLFAWAGEAGFVGLAVYFACWFFMFPLMIVASIIFGAVIWWGSGGEMI